MFNLANCLSLVRIPLALVFLQQNDILRIMGIVLALISDGLDGYVARRYKEVTQFGAILDPLMDKFFVFFALIILYGEDQVSMEQMASMLCRDFSVMFFGLYLMLKGMWAGYQFRSIWCGKITTVIQSMVLIGLSCHIRLPGVVFASFIILGILALFELYFVSLMPKSD